MRHKRCGFDPWVGKIPWKGNGNLLQYSFLKNPMDRGAWWAIVHRTHKQLNTTEPPNTHMMSLHKSLFQIFYFFALYWPSMDIKCIFIFRRWLSWWFSSKETSCNSGAAGDEGLIPGEGNATHSSILAWRIQWTEEPSGI